MEPRRSGNQRRENPCIENSGTSDSHLGEGGSCLNNNASLATTQYQIRDAIDAFRPDDDGIWVIGAHGIVYKWEVKPGQAL